MKTNELKEHLYCELAENQLIEVEGGSWLSYYAGYLLSWVDNHVVGKDATRYGGVYLESIGSRSSIM